MCEREGERERERGRERERERERERGRHHDQPSDAVRRPTWSTGGVDLALSEKDKDLPSSGP